MKKTMPKRQYHDGDLVEFNFEPNSFDVQCCEVKLVGVVSGILHESKEIRYRIQLMDKKRDISGEMVIYEEHINRKIEIAIPIEG